MLGAKIREKEGADKDGKWHLDHAQDSLIGLRER
jgi:hypothetical protein